MGCCLSTLNENDLLDSAPLLPVEIETFTTIVPGPSIVNEGKPRRSAYSTSNTLPSLQNDVTNLYENFLHGLQIAGPNSPYLGYRSQITNALGNYKVLSMLI